MQQTPKRSRLFENGRCQCVRIPAEFRLEAEEVTFERDEETGVLTITPVAAKVPWKEWFASLDPGFVKELQDHPFVLDRDGGIDLSKERSLFENED